MRGSRTTSKRSWEIISEFSARGDGDKAVTEAVLNLAIDAVDAPADPAQLLRALRIAQSALRGEKARGEAAEERARMGGDLSAAPAQDIAQLTEKLRMLSASQLLKVTEDLVDRVDRCRDDRKELEQLVNTKTILDKRRGADGLLGGSSSSTLELQAMRNRLERPAPLGRQTTEPSGTTSQQRTPTLRT